MCVHTHSHNFTNQIEETKQTHTINYNVHNPLATQFKNNNSQGYGYCRHIIFLPLISTLWFLNDLKLFRLDVVIALKHATILIALNSWFLYCLFSISPFTFQVFLYFPYFSPRKKKHHLKHCVKIKRYKQEIRWFQEFGFSKWFMMTDPLKSKCDFRKLFLRILKLKTIAW